METKGLEWLQENFVGHNLKFSYEDKKGFIIEGNCKLKNRDITEIPYKIYKVIGDFDCGGLPNKPNYIKTLNNFPDIVNGNFYVSFNEKLTSLEGGPCEVDGTYFCNNCKLYNLDGVASNIGRNLKAFSNPIHEVSVLKNVHVGGYVDLDFTPVYDNTPIKDRIIGNYTCK